MAIGDYTDSRLVGPMAVPTGSIAQSAPPSNMMWIIKQILIVNTSGAAVQGVQCSIETGTPSNPAAARVVDINVQPKDVECINTHLILNGVAGDKFCHTAPSGSAGTITVCGLQKQVS